MVVVALVSVLAVMSVPAIATGLDDARARAAARYLTAQMAFARTRAATRGATIALRFERAGSDITVSLVQDGNGNGVRTREIDEGLDLPITEPVRLGDLFPGVAIGVPPGSEEDPLRVGAADLLSFTPAGTATSGTVHVTGRGGAQFAIRVLGATGRVRLLRYLPATGAWVESL